VGRNPSWTTNRPLPTLFASKAMVTTEFVEKLAFLLLKDIRNQKK
jgi:hypothetical protein